MSDQPLQPFGPPTSLTHFLGTQAASSVITWFLYFALAFWAVYTVVAIYHWLKYSHASVIAIPAIILHLIVSFVLISYALSGAFFI